MAITHCMGKVQSNISRNLRMVRLWKGRSAWVQSMVDCLCALTFVRCNLLPDCVRLLDQKRVGVIYLLIEKGKK
jgi:hypothetical protein